MPTVGTTTKFIYLRCIAKDNNNINTIVGDGCGHSFLFQKKKLLKLILPKLLLKKYIRENAFLVF